MEYVVLGILILTIGFLLGYYCGYKAFLDESKRGTFVIDSNDMDKDIFRIEVDTFKDIEKLNYISFKVKNLD